MDMIKLDPWLTGILANPITKIPTSPDAFPYIDGVIDARIFLKNTHGYDDWANGQTEYEQWADSDCTTEEQYKKEIDYDRPIYNHYLMSGRILDCGGGQALCASSLQQMLNLFLPIRGSLPPLLTATLARRPINV
jgi:hypothetical protein